MISNIFGVDKGASGTDPGKKYYQQIEKNLSKISDYLYVSRFEVSNKIYRTFLNDLIANHKSEDYKIASVDTAGWLRGPLDNTAYASNYHANKKWDDYPVVNISYEGAALFCNWLTEKYNSYSGRKYKNAKFELPSEVEWERAAYGGKINPLYSCGDSLQNKDGKFMYNFRQEKNQSGVLNQKDDLLLAPCKSYWQNNYGIYNMSGNAAEMISEKGITKGGSFIDDKNSLALRSKGKYSQPASNIGFRFFMHVIRKSNN